MAAEGVTLIRLKRGRLVALAAVFAAFALPFWAVAALRFPWSGGFAFADGLALAGAAMFSAFALSLAGLTLRNPVALRLDAQGMSGFHAPAPFRWSDIAMIGDATTGHHTHAYLRLRDPDDFPQLRSPLHRLAQPPLPKGFHTSIRAAHLTLNKPTLTRLLTKYQTAAPRP